MTNYETLTVPARGVRVGDEMQFGTDWLGVVAAVTCSQSIRFEFAASVMYQASDWPAVVRRPVADPAPDPRREVPKSDASIDAECLRTADHDDEVDAFRREVRKLIERYWFIGRAELLGAMEVEKFLALTRLTEPSDEGDGGDEWKREGVRAP